MSDDESDEESDSSDQEVAIPKPASKKRKTPDAVCVYGIYKCTFLNTASVAARYLLCLSHGMDARQPIHSERCWMKYALIMIHFTLSVWTYVLPVAPF